MFRTKDFILLFSAVVFLLVAISATAFFKSNLFTITDSDISFVEVEENVDYSAELYSPESISREDRLTEMRRKIAEGGELVISEPEEVIVDTSETDIEEITAQISDPIKCADYREFAGAWPISDLNTDLIEGARIYYLEHVTYVQTEVISTTSSSSLSVHEEVNREVLLQMPALSVSNNMENCLKTDVIGIAKDGSLIRNNEAGLYGVFDESTLVGYALDGFPIHGVSAKPSDVCGGHNSVDGYGYYINSESDSIINCFSSNQASL
jgi:hypothetical protein